MQGYLRAYLAVLVKALVVHFNPTRDLQDTNVLDSIAFKTDLRTAAEVASDLFRSNASAERLKELSIETNRAVFQAALKQCWAKASRLSDLGMADLRWSDVQEAFDIVLDNGPRPVATREAARLVAERFLRMVDLREQTSSSEEHYCWLLNLMLLAETVSKATRTGAHDVFRAANIVSGWLVLYVL